jgi:hypothetical protein
LPTSGEPQQSPAPSTITSGEVELGPGNFDLLDPRVGLDALASYSESLTLTFDGTRGGQQSQWTKTYSFSHTEQPLASTLYLEISGDANSTEPAFIGEATGAAYEADDDGVCVGDVIDSQSSDIVLREPARLLGGLLGADEAGSESVNGVAADHYTFDERAMAEAGRAETDGEVWLAPAGYVVQYTRTTIGDAAYFGGGEAGTITWVYELRDIDQVQQVVLPAGCQVDAPAMPDATNLLNLPRSMGFDTPSSVEDTTAFYQEPLVDQGWTISSDPLVGEGGTLTTFAKGDESLNVIVNSGDNGTRVDILLSHPE